MNRQRVAAVSELVEGVGQRVEVGELEIALFKVGDTVYATNDVCSHAEASLSEGEVYIEECEVECPLHGSTFDLRSGEVMCLPATESIATYPVIIEGDDVWVEV